MGLDISICVDNDKQVYSGDYYDPATDYFNKHSLSRTFCNLMCRKDVVSGEPELDQIGRIISVDISPILAMERSSVDDDGELTFLLDATENEEERKAILQQFELNREMPEDNIDNVLSTIELLIEKLSVIDDLPDLLTDNGYSTLDYNYYFTDFNNDKGQGYIGNNFGQDLRNFKRFLEFAKAKGTKTVHFSYG